VQLTDTVRPESDPVWSPDGSRIAFREWSSNDMANICVINVDGSGHRCLTDDQVENGTPAWSPDGEWLAFRSPRGGIPAIDLIPVDGETRRSLITGVSPKGDPVWSPDGWRLAFQADADGDMEIFTIVTFSAENELIRLTNITAYDGEPAWIAR